MQRLAETIMEDQVCRDLSHKAGLTFSRTMVPSESTSCVCLLWRFLGGVSMRTEVVYWVCWLWELPGGTSLGQLLPMSCLGSPGMIYKAICRWLLLVLGLEVPRKGQVANQWQGLGTLSERYGAC